MSQNQTRRCGYCLETNHNIRTCGSYITDTHELFMNEYVQGTENRNVFAHTALENGHLRILARKAGFRLFHIRRETMQNYLDGFHRHYIQLANAERQRLRDVRNEAFLQTHRRTVRQLPGYLLDMRTTRDPAAVEIYTPNYHQGVEIPYTPVQAAVPNPNPRSLLPRFGNSGNLQEDILQFAQENNIQPVSVVRNLLQELMELGPVETPRNAPRNASSVLLHIDASKFPEDISSCECPICYETSEKMAVTKCGHVYCQPCINTWMQAKQNPSCAVCRSSIKDIYLDNEANLDYMLHL